MTLKKWKKNLKFFFKKISPWQHFTNLYLLPDSQYVLWRMKKYEANEKQQILKMHKRVFNRNDFVSSLDRL